jgi:maltooligosyltrehalose trehalohydrolase
MTTAETRRKYAQGVELTPAGASFRIWAPEHRRVEAVLAGRETPIALHKEADGYWSTFIDEVVAGDRYRYRLDGQAPDFPDPVARFLPEGPHGPAEVVDPSAFPWSDAGWKGIDRDRMVIYELHVGTFSPEADWSGAAAKLPWLRDLGITCVEIMPVAEFDGLYGWGYDGVAWYAPSHLYGTPDGFRVFVDQAHRLGLAVMLDVVYNHFGAAGDYSAQFSRYYKRETKNAWGMALNYDGEHAHGMRSLVIDNAAYWIDEFHLDGLRLDATQAIEDASVEHVITALARSARAAAAGRPLFLVGENEPQDVRLLGAQGEPGVGSGLDALWNDDFHHSALVALTGRRQAYYSDYTGAAGEWAATARQGLLFQGQRSSWQNTPRGRTPRGLPMDAFVTFLENHDQVANSLWSTRLWQQSSPAQYRAMTALLLLGPWTPLLFQGQEWASTAPFMFFAGHEPELAAAVKKGRSEFLAQFPGCRLNPELLPNPAAQESFEQCRLRWDEVEDREHVQSLRLHQDLLRLRDLESVLGAKAPAGVRLETATLSPSCAIFRYYAETSRAASEDRILLVNLGAGLEFPHVSEPLLAPVSPQDLPHWRMSWTSEAPAYGGHGCAEPDARQMGWIIPGSAAALLVPSRW